MERVDVIRVRQTIADMKIECAILVRNIELNLLNSLPPVPERDVNIVNESVIHGYEYAHNLMHDSSLNTWHTQFREMYDQQKSQNQKYIELKTKILKLNQWLERNGG